VEAGGGHLTVQPRRTTVQVPFCSILCGKTWLIAPDCPNIKRVFSEGVDF